jgi:UDP-N-acetylglucosamine 2-epimerase (non-hydrolysing)
VKYVIVAGARPNFMKVAPILEAFRSGRSEHSLVLVHTGQHYDAAMSGDFFRDLGLPQPDIELGVGSGSHAEQTARVMLAFERFCGEHKPQWVIVVGDVNSTVACALTAKKLGIAVAHVEAGLRSWDMLMPEEINRLCTDAISDLLFTTEKSANLNLAKEGIPKERIYFVGNTMIDTLLRHIDAGRALALPPQFQPGAYSVLTLHRPANVDSTELLQGLLDALEPVTSRMPVAFPVHPRTVRRLEEVRVPANLICLEPMSYIRFLGLVANSRMVLTDSGGIQEETTVLGIPCVTLRNSTERPVTCEMGTNILAGTDPDHIRQVLCSVLSKPKHAARVPPKWDGKAGQRIAEVLLTQGSAKARSAAPAIQHSFSMDRVSAG